jgi:hypothetical protein
MRMLNEHPLIAVIPEIGWIPQRYEDRDDLTQEGLVTPALIEDLLQKGRLGRFTSLPLNREELQDLLVSDNPISYAELLTLIFNRYGQLQGKSLVGNKTPEYVQSLGTLHDLWPQAKFVHIIRDGRDVCLSALSWRRVDKLAESYATWREDAVSTAALWWEWHVRLACEVGRGLGTALYYEIRYEALVADPAAECAALCAFLDVPYNDAMLRFHEGRVKTDPDLDAKHAWLPLTPGLRDWRTQMASEDVTRFEAAAGDLLDELGYPRRAPVLPAPALTHAARLRELFEWRPLPQRWQAVPIS